MLLLLLETNDKCNNGKQVYCYEPVTSVCVNVTIRPNNGLGVPRFRNRTSVSILAEKFSNNEPLTITDRHVRVHKSKDRKDTTEQWEPVWDFSVGSIFKHYKRGWQAWFHCMTWANWKEIVSKTDLHRRGVGFLFKTSINILFSALQSTIVNICTIHIYLTTYFM